MEDLTTPAADRPKRTDVGYCRPPKEHQFKKGHKRAERKKKEKHEAPPSVQISRVLRAALQEKRRVKISGKVRWPSAAELIIHRAYQEAEKGSATLRRELTRLLLSLESSTSDQRLSVVTDPTASEQATALKFVPVGEAN